MVRHIGGHRIREDLRDKIDPSPLKSPILNLRSYDPSDSEPIQVSEQLGSYQIPNIGTYDLGPMANEENSYEAFKGKVLSKSKVGEPITYL